MWLSEQKHDMLAHKLKLILLPQLIATLNNYVSSLPPLANVNWSALPKYLCWPCKSTTAEMGPKGGLQFGCGDLMLLPLSVHICISLVVEWWSFVGTCTCHSYSKLYYLCHLTSLFKFSPSPTPPSHPHPFICAGQILVNSMKIIIKNWWKSTIMYLPC